MKLYPRKGYAKHLEIIHTMGHADEAGRAAAFAEQQALLRSATVPEDIIIETKTIAGPDEGQELELRILRTADLPENAPIIMDIHGGGWVGGVTMIDDFRNALLVKYVPCIVVSVEYRLAPKNPFPAALMDCYTAYCWIHDHAEELGGDPNRMGLHGTSAGANLVAGLSLYIRDNGGPEIKLAAMVNPPYSFNEKTPSFYQMTYYPLAGECDYQHTAETLYLGNLKGQAPSYYAFPANAPTLLGFPKSLIIVSEYDQLRDDGINFAQRLYAEGVPCELTVAPRVGHGFMVVNDPMTHQFAQRMADSFRNEFDLI